MSYLGEGSDFRGQTISKPPGQKNAVRQVNSYLGEAQDFAKQNQQSLFGGNKNNQQSNDNNTGIQAFQQTQQGGSGGGSGSNIAQQILGDICRAPADRKSVV